MPWKEVSIMSQREELIVLARSPGANLSQLCRRFGVSRKTLYKWLGRYQPQNPSSLADRSRRPHRCAGQTPPPIQRQIVALRQEHPAWGARKIRSCLLQEHLPGVPCPSVVHQVLAGHGLIDSEAWRQRTALLRFEYPHPNDLWQMDYKGHFALASGRCHPLCVLDDHSRYCLGLWACADEKGLTVQGHLTEMFRRYGLPLGMLMDNGSPWGQGLTSLSVWLMRLGIRVLHGRASHPQTQGKLERFNRTLAVEGLGGRAWADLVACQGRLDQWREVYNLRRPHEALAMHPPASRYRPSPRAFPETLEPIEYSPGDLVLRVGQSGTIRFQGRSVPVGSALAGLPVGVRAGLEEGVYEVYFCRQRIARIGRPGQNTQP